MVKEKVLIQNFQEHSSAKLKYMPTTFKNGIRLQVTETPFPTPDTSIHETYALAETVFSPQM